MHDIAPQVVVVDHYDSYPWNLVHLIAGVTGTLPAVVQHDTTTADYVLGFDYVVLSPGPGHPANRGDFAVGGEVCAAGCVTTSRASSRASRRCAPAPSAGSPPDGRADLGVVIRSLTAVGNGTWELGTGGGITVRSTAQDEYAETGWKAERLLQVFGTPLRCN